MTGVRSRAAASLLAVLVSCAAAGAAPAQTGAITIPFTLDHNRIVVDAVVPAKDGARVRVRCWVDTGNADLWLSLPLANRLGLEVTGEKGKPQYAPPPAGLSIGGLELRLGDIKAADVVMEDAIGRGLPAQINLPAAVLRHYDAVVDYPHRTLTLGPPGSVHFNGTAAGATVNPENGLIQLPGAVAGERHHFGLDLGATVSFVAGDTISQWHRAHPRWPWMRGAVGPANLWGLDDEPRWQLLRVPQVEYGGVKLAGVCAVSLPADIMGWIRKRAGTPTSGIIGADALKGQRIGLDYAHATVYFESLAAPAATGFDVVGVVLRPEADGRYLVLGVADFAGKPAVPGLQRRDLLLEVNGQRVTGHSMGEVWAMLGGKPGETRSLKLERDGRPFVLRAVVRRFLGAGAI